MKLLRRDECMVWLRDAISANVPAETISQFVRKRHREDIGQSRNLCGEWLHLSLQRLPELSIAPNSDIDESDSLDEESVSSAPSVSVSSISQGSDLADIARTVLSEIDSYEDENATPVISEHSASQIFSDSLPQDDMASDRKTTSSVPILSDLVYPIELLRSALIAMHELNIDVSGTVSDYLAFSLTNARLILPALHIMGANLQNIGALPSGKESEIELAGHLFRPTITDYICIDGSQFRQPHSELMHSGFQSAADDSRMKRVRSATSLLVQRFDCSKYSCDQAAMYQMAEAASSESLVNNNRGVVSAMYQLAEAASLRLTPQHVLDRFTETVQLALKLPRRSRSFRSGTRDSITSVATWSVRSHCPLLWSAGTKSGSYAFNMLCALDAAYSDQNSILACVHRLQMRQSIRSDRDHLRLFGRSVLLRASANRDLLHAAQNDIDLDSPSSILSSPTSKTKRKTSIYDLDFVDFCDTLMVLRCRGETSRAIALFGVVLDTLTKLLPSVSTDWEFRLILNGLKTTSHVLLVGGPSSYQLRSFPPALVGFLTQWVHVLEHGGEPVSNHTELEGLDHELCDRIFASTAVLHAQVKSHVGFDLIINSMRLNFQVFIIFRSFLRVLDTFFSLLFYYGFSMYFFQAMYLESLHVPLHESLARVSSREFLELCRHSHASVSRWFPSLGAQPDVSNGLVFVAPRAESEVMNLVQQQNPAASFAVPFLQVSCSAPSC